MKTHQSNPNSKPDIYYKDGNLKYLVVGNECRLLDQRRTPGKIIKINLVAGFFVWQIDDFEDKGKFWEVEFEKIHSFQFLIHCKEASTKELEFYNQQIELLNKNIEIYSSSEAEKNIIKLLNERMNLYPG